MIQGAISEMTAPFLLILKIDAWNSEARVHLIHYTAVQCMEGFTTDEGEEGEEALHSRQLLSPI